MATVESISVRVVEFMRHQRHPVDYKAACLLNKPHPCNNAVSSLFLRHGTGPSGTSLECTLAWERPQSQSESAIMGAAQTDSCSTRLGPGSAPLCARALAYEVI